MKAIKLKLMDAQTKSACGADRSVMYENEF